MRTPRRLPRDARRPSRLFMVGFGLSMLASLAMTVLMLVILFGLARWVWGLS